MKNKYYTPSIEEFYVGFECEIYDDDDKTWDLVYVDTQPGLCNITGLDLDIRVKYLDKSDIEDLGFTHIGALWFESKELDCRIRKWKGLEIDIYHDWSRNDGEHTDHYKVFRGTIKNKSELKILLKQLNIK
jgi:hypothetical protein